MARILLTGANSGIGAATAVALARRGHEVVGTVRSDEAAEAVARHARDAGVPIRPVVLALDDAADCERVVSTMTIDVLVNNAAYTNMGAIEDVPDDDIRRHLEVNLVAPVRLARLVLPQMRERGHGRIITVSSVLAFLSLPLWGWYDATKRALVATMDSLRMEVAGAGIDVILIAPGAVRTPVYERERDELAARATHHYRDAYDRWCRLSRRLEPIMSRPDRVAATIVEAAEAAHARALYRVGRGSRLGQRALLLLPTGVRERALRLPVGL
jgi:NAD(P)-dependent dehydrogenase (short-subunit alcohol dehydrogenase family)